LGLLVPNIAMKKELFEELKQSLREAKLIKRGQLRPGRVFRLNPESNIVRVRGASARTPTAASH
jgi:hypothetical protein